MGVRRLVESQMRPAKRTRSFDSKICISFKCTSLLQFHAEREFRGSAWRLQILLLLQTCPICVCCCFWFVSVPQLKPWTFHKQVSVLERGRRHWPEMMLRGEAVSELALGHIWALNSRQTLWLELVNTVHVFHCTICCVQKTFGCRQWRSA